MHAPVLLAPHGAETLAFRDCGTGPAVVFLHDMGLDHRVWDAVIPLLPPGLRRVMLDMRGHGASSTPPGPYTMGSLIRDTEGVLDHLGIRDCVLVGSGLGGMVAQGLAVKRLDQIRALVLANTAPRIGTKARWDALIAQSPDMASYFDRLFTPAFRASTAFAPWAALLAARRKEAVSGAARAIAGSDFYTTTASLRLPCLVIASSEDQITPADMARELADLIPGAGFALIRRAGHLPMIEQPDAFAKALNTFLHSIGHPA